MCPPGFIHGKLDIKLLVLYLLSRVEAPVDFAVLTDLALCDEGVDYFQFAQAVAELVDSGHLSFADGLYAATEKGKRNSADTESSLALPVRVKSDLAVSKLNAILRRDAQVRAEVTPEAEGGFRVNLALDDHGGTLLTLSLLCASEPQAVRMAARFRAKPEALYNGILEILLKEE